MAGYDVELVELRETCQPGYFFRYYSFSELSRHALHVVLVEPKFLSDLPVQEVQSHQLEAQTPHFQGWVGPSNTVSVRSSN